ncbi:type II toxin-antitoxin system HipA family toxin [Bordetella genomosp. 13]|uniref:type II toxin-antitoxin system HipA family toxin n=1 Tax=Bordetella genomosp. 13 TaxID=463040 RepID=UPI0011A74A79|nr:type II toxin-antitoxin system HipA family toxin [Bordetella genomosp. 13]
MKTLEVIYRGWGQQWTLGRLAQSGRDLLFEYAPQALERGLELSPRALPLRRGAFQKFPAHQWQLPGLIADSLPDGWGLLLMDRLLRKHGVRTETLSPLDRLAFIGDRAMGALSYQPESDLVPDSQDLSLLALAQEAQAIVQGEDSAALQTLARLGGSPHGARPKVLVYFDPSTRQVGTHPFPNAAPWLVKFQAGGEHPEVCAIEQLYAHLARAFGIDMPDTHLFQLDRRLAAFGVRRFDREAGMRVPMLSMAGALDLDFRQPAVGYDVLLKLTRFMTRSQAEVDHAYRRAVFNVIFHNRDDHTKNFAYRLDRDGHWRLAPGYDLTYSHGPAGEHFMDVCGAGNAVTRADLLRLAGEGGVQASEATRCIDQAVALADGFAAQAAQFPIRAATRQALVRDIRGCAGALR